MPHDADAVAERHNLAVKVSAACRNLERVLERKSEDYYSYTPEQAMDVFGIQTYKIWTAWAILTNRISITDLDMEDKSDFEKGAWVRGKK